MMTTCAVNENSTRKSLRSLVLNSRLVVAMAELFSLILEKKVSCLKALCMLNSMVSFTSLLLFGGTSVLVALPLLCWFGVSVLQCSLVGEAD